VDGVERERGGYSLVAMVLRSFAGYGKVKHHDASLDASVSV